MSLQDVGPGPLRTNFPRLAGAPRPTEHVKKRAYLDHGIAILDINDPRLTWDQQEIIKHACRRIYGAG